MSQISTSFPQHLKRPWWIHRHLILLFLSTPSHHSTQLRVTSSESRPSVWCLLFLGQFRSKIQVLPQRPLFCLCLCLCINLHHDGRGTVICLWTTTMQKVPGAGRIYADDREGDEDLVAKFTDIIPCQRIVNGCRTAAAVGIDLSRSWRVPGWV